MEAMTMEELETLYSGLWEQRSRDEQFSLRFNQGTLLFLPIIFVEKCFWEGGLGTVHNNG